MRSWIPVPGTTTGKLVAAALELFGTHGFAPVGVVGIAAHAGVTTGSLYHHFGSKAGLYQLVRADVEQRVLDRLAGAAAGRSVRTVADLAPIVLVGFDYLITSGFARLLGEAGPVTEVEAADTDEIERFLGGLLPDGGAAVSPLLGAAWRTALWQGSDGPGQAAASRAALVRLLTGS